MVNMDNNSGQSIAEQINSASTLQDVLDVLSNIPGPPMTALHVAYTGLDLDALGLAEMIWGYVGKDKDRTVQLVSMATTVMADPGDEIDFGPIKENHEIAQLILTASNVEEAASVIEREIPMMALGGLQ